MQPQMTEDMMMMGGMQDELAMIDQDLNMTRRATRPFVPQSDPAYFDLQRQVQMLEQMPEQPIRAPRNILAKKVERPDVVMAIHPRLEGEFWGPTVDLLLDENIKVAFTAFNEEHFKQALERLDYVFAKYVFKGLNPWVSGHVKQTPHDPNMIWASNQYLIVFQ